jgi:hypothetical protein
MTSAYIPVLVAMYRPPASAWCGTELEVSAVNPSCVGRCLTSGPGKRVTEHAPGARSAIKAVILSFSAPIAGG